MDRKTEKPIYELLSERFGDTVQEESKEIRNFIDRVRDAEAGGFLGREGTTAREWIERLVLVAVNGKRYDSRVRLALVKTCVEDEDIGIPAFIVDAAENRLADLLRRSGQGHDGDGDVNEGDMEMEGLEEEYEEGEEEPRSRTDSLSITVENKEQPRSMSSKMKTVAAVSAGGLVAAVAGGFAAPALGILVSKIGLGAVLAQVAATTGVSGTIFSAGFFGFGGGAAAGVAVRKIEGEAGSGKLNALSLIRVKEPPQNMRVVIGVGDWLSPEYGSEHTTRPWDVVLRLACPEADLMAASWDVDHRKELGTAIASWSSDGGFNTTKFPRSLWDKCVESAERAGKELAELLLRGDVPVGRRPVTLVGVGLGGSMVFSALEALADASASSGNDDSNDIRYGTIENCVLIGAAVNSDLQRWCTVRKVVAGRLCCVFSHHDQWLSMASEDEACGLNGVIGGAEFGVENIDASMIVKSHAELEEKQLVAVCRHVGVLSYSTPPELVIPPSMNHTNA